MARTLGPLGEVDGRHRFRFLFLSGDLEITLAVPRSLTENENEMPDFKMVIAPFGYLLSGARDLRTWEEIGYRMLLCFGKNGALKLRMKTVRIQIEQIL
ncbi:hypothetical protein NDU88_003197 [Pleurodeles waltl]|uniref:Uncharacterized protein n=1 Tax=Pleurodeles waltl TaxID=8319 RepID=A0AAV7WUM3_PLEWA|nr:hypothetical protein NDU88_003197 [Pleurodeles waltl]